MIRTSAEPMIEVCEEDLMNPLWTGRPKLSAKIERNILVFETRVVLNVLVQGRGQTVDSEALDAHSSRKSRDEWGTDLHFHLRARAGRIDGWAHLPRSFDKLRTGSGTAARPSGAKAQLFSAAFCGTTEVVP